MIGALSNWWHAFTGSGEHAVTVPPMDGPLHPNAALERAVRIAGAGMPDNLAVWRGRVVFSDGTRLVGLDGGGTTELLRFDAPITAIAAEGEALAVALDNGGIELHEAGDRPTRLKLPVEQVDLTIDAGREALRHNATFLGVLRSMSGAPVVAGKERMIPGGAAPPPRPSQLTVSQ